LQLFEAAEKTRYRQVSTVLVCKWKVLQLLMMMMMRKAQAADKLLATVSPVLMQDVYA